MPDDVTTERLFTIDANLLEDLRATPFTLAGRDDFEVSRDAFMLYGGMGPRIYLKADGCIVWFGCEMWDHRGMLGDAYSAIAFGAKRLRIPRMLTLLPPRAADASECAHCAGSGWFTPGGTLRDEQGLPKSFPCSDCGALGWTSPSLDLTAVVAKPLQT